MTANKDIEIIRIFIRRCAKEHKTLKEMGEAVGRTKQWASRLVQGKIKSLRFTTRSMILEYLGKL